MFGHFGPNPCLPISLHWEHAWRESLTALRNFPSFFTVKKPFINLQTVHKSGVTASAVKLKSGPISSLQPDASLIPPF